MHHHLSFGTLRRCILVLAAFVAVAIPAGSAAASQLRFTPWVRAVAEARPSVVNIQGRKTIRSADQQFGAESFRQVNGMGTGVIIDQRGYVITNYHVVEGVSRIEITLDDKTSTVGKLVAHDPKTDVAILKISVGRKLPVLKIGTSSDLMAAEPVIAIGNAYGYRHTVTRGIISELERSVQVSEDQEYDNLIQTDASINPGNSGGPLLNIDGEMIGLNVAVRVGAQGIGFAIPVDQVMQIAAELLNAEQLGNISHGVIGETAIDAPGSQFVIRDVSEDTPAARSGLQAGDVVASVDGEEIVRSLDFERAMLRHQVGDRVRMQVHRGDADVAVELVVTKPNARDRAWQTIGLRLASIDTDAFSAMSSRYRGGMKVVSVRSGSPAERTGIQAGDVLVGILGWETISLENVKYILNSDEFQSDDPIKFYILRGSETLFGHMRIAQRQSS